MTTVNSEQKEREEDRVPSTSSEHTLSTIEEEIALAGVCNVGMKALQASTSSTAGAQFPVRVEQPRTLQASTSSPVAQFSLGQEKITALQAAVNSTKAIQFSIWEEKEQISNQFVSLWTEAIHRLGNICSMEFNAPPAPMCPTETAQSTGREERRRTSEVVEDFIGGLENFCLLEDRHGVHSRRSPLPSWYPRRPLQDITAVLNIGPVLHEEASKLKKGSKKAHISQLHGRLNDNIEGAFGHQRAPRVPLKPTSPMLAAPKRSALLRKGFR